MGKRDSGLAGRVPVVYQKEVPRGCEKIGGCSSQGGWPRIARRARPAKWRWIPRRDRKTELYCYCSVSSRPRSSTFSWKLQLPPGTTCHTVYYSRRQTAQKRLHLYGCGIPTGTPAGGRKKSGSTTRYFHVQYSKFGKMRRRGAPNQGANFGTTVYCTVLYCKRLMAVKTVLL